MLIIFSGVLIYLLIVLLSALGYFFFYKNNTSDNEVSVYPLAGFSIVIIISNFLFYALKLSSLEISILILFLSSIFIFLCFRIKKNFLRYCKKIIFFSLPILVFYISLSFLWGEQFYVFRGNKWDWFAIITSSHYLSNLNTHDFLNLSNNFNWENFENYKNINLSAYHDNIKIWLLKIVNIYLISSFFLILKFNSVFFNLYLLKVFSLILIFLSIYDFFKKYITSKNFIYIYFCSLIFVFSFWIIYINEADYYRQLISFAFFIYLLARVDNFFKYFEDKYNNNLILNILFIYALYIIYIELLFIYSIILFLFFIFYKKKLLFLKNNFYKIILILLGVILITLPSQELIITQILGQLDFSKSENRWWTYFGAFIFGKSSPALDLEFANEFKNLIYENSNSYKGYDNISLKNIILILSKTINKYNYENVYLSIIPSISGFYYLTDLFKFQNFKFLNYLFLIFLNLYFIKIIFNNLKIIFLSKIYLLKNLKIFISVLIIFSGYFIINGKLWTFLKLYMYFSPVIFLLIIFSFSKQGKTTQISINKFLIIPLIIFPFYKFGNFNSGIGKFDSFPSIQKKAMKENIQWEFKISKYKECKTIKLNFDNWDYYNPKTIPDRFKSIYLTVHLLDNNYKFVDYKILSYQKEDYTKKVDCIISDLR